MLKLSANISLLYPELPFLDRVDAAVRSGFGAVEVMYPYAFDARELKEALDCSGATLSVLNAPPGDYQGGERGLAALPGREADFRESLETAVHYALTTQCGNIHVLTGNVQAGLDEALLEATIHRNLSHAAALFAQHGLTLLLEPLSRQMLPDYSLTRVEEASRWLQVLKAEGHDNVSLQVDLYHTQMEQGNLAALLRRYLPEISYIQIAGVPGRHEPTIGEINYRYLLDLLREQRFSGWVGCEYVPMHATDAGLAWARDWGLLKRPEKCLANA